MYDLLTPREKLLLVLVAAFFITLTLLAALL
jgi:hypothetical protein